MFLPAGVDECFATATDGYCAQPITSDQTSFCAYHSFFASGPPPLYDIMPWADVPGCQSDQSPNGANGNDPLDDELSLVSHEHSETITDPYATSWSDAHGNEVGDICTQPDQFGDLSGLFPSQFNETINDDNYLLQENFSNQGDACRARFEAHFSAPAATHGRPTPFAATSSSASGHRLLQLELRRRIAPPHHCGSIDLARLRTGRCVPGHAHDDRNGWPHRLGHPPCCGIHGDR